MRIKARLPQVKPHAYDEPRQCPYEGCSGHHFKPHGRKGEEKSILDPQYGQVTAYRYKCLKCGRTFRNYPHGVSQAQQSDRVKGMSVLLYVLGLSYGAVEDFMEAIGVAICRTTVYNNVQEAGIASRHLQREELEEGGKRPVIGTDGTYVKVKGQEVCIQVAVDDGSGELLGLNVITSESSEEVLELVEDVGEKVGADVLVSDDLDAYKESAEETGMKHQICRKHVKDNVDDLADELREQLKEGRAPPKGEGLSEAQVVEDLEQIQGLVAERPDDGAQQLERLYHRYKGVRQPPPGHRHGVWYRTRMLITRLWDRWQHLTLDKGREDMDGTNNSCERLIGWWIKEHYRTMRGYKRIASIENVVTLTSRMGLRSGYYDMTELYN